MKLKVLLILVSSFFFNSLFSQESGDFTLSGRAGVGQSFLQTRNTGFSNTASRLSLSAGLLTDYWITEDVSLQSGFILISKGGELTLPEPRSTHRYELLYGEIPLTPKYTWKYERFKLHSYLGPAMNLLFSSRHYTSEEFSDPRKGHDGAPDQSVNRADLSLIYGFGVNTSFVNKGNFFADLRLGQDLSSFSSLDGDQLFNHYYSISAGYIFK